MYVCLKQNIQYMLYNFKLGIIPSSIVLNIWSHRISWMALRLVCKFIVLKMSWLIPGDPRTHRWHLHRSWGKQELFSRMGAGFYHSINRKSGQPIEDGLSLA